MNEILVERLNELYNKTNLSQIRYAKEIGVAQPSINKWLAGETTPSLECVEMVARYHKCSVDWLLGIEHLDKESIAEIIKEQMNVFKLTGQQWIKCDQVIELVNAIYGKCL